MQNACRPPLCCFVFLGQAATKIKNQQQPRNIIMASSSTTLVNLDYEYASKISLFASQLGDGRYNLEEDQYVTTLINI